MFIVMNFEKTFQVPGGVKHEGKGVPGCFTCATVHIQKVLMKSETRMRTVYLQQT